MEHGDIINTR